MKIGSFDTGEKVFVIAEIGNNHEGSFALAQELVGLAAEAGADAVKFQTFVPEILAGADAARLARLRSFLLTREQFALLARQAKDLGILFFSTPFDLGSALFLNDLQPVFKIASGDNTFFPLMDAIAGFAKPLLVSTGLADVALVRRLHDRIQGVWQRAGVNPGLALLHCVASYPTPPEQAALGAIRALRVQFPGAEVGYSDHTLGIQAAPLAVAAGARIIEKHFTIANDHSEFRDHQLSANPEALRRMVQEIRAAETMLGPECKVPQACEAACEAAMRRSIAAARDLKAGTVLTLSDLTWARPGTGLAPGQESLLLGRRLRHDRRLGAQITQDDIEPGGA
jgi:Sialic acid synthase